MLVLIAGCGGGAKNADKSTDNATSASTVKTDTPESVFAAFQDHMSKGEFERIYDLFSNEDKKMFDDQAKQFADHQKKQPISANDLALMKKYGVTDVSIANPQGRDMLRISLVSTQLMAAAFTPKGKTPPNVIDEVQKEAAKVKLIGVKKSADGQTAVVTTQDSKGKTQEGKVVFEDGQWKMQGGKKNETSSSTPPAQNPTLKLNKPPALKK